MVGFTIHEGESQMVSYRGTDYNYKMITASSIPGNTSIGCGEIFCYGHFVGQMCEPSNCTYNKEDDISCNAINCKCGDPVIFIKQISGNMTYYVDTNTMEDHC